MYSCRLKTEPTVGRTTPSFFTQPYRYMWGTSPTAVVMQLMAVIFLFCERLAPLRLPAELIPIRRVVPLSVGLVSAYRVYSSLQDWYQLVVSYSSPWS